MPNGWERKVKIFRGVKNVIQFISFSASVCRRWRQIAYDTKLWKNVSLRPEISGSLKFFAWITKLINWHFSLKVFTWDRWNLCSRWFPFDSGRLCGTLSLASSWSLIQCFMNWLPNAPTWRTCYSIFQQVGQFEWWITRMLKFFQKFSQSKFERLQATHFTFQPCNFTISASCKLFQLSSVTSAFACPRLSSWKVLCERSTTSSMGLKFFILSEPTRKWNKKKKKFMWEPSKYLSLFNQLISINNFRKSSTFTSWKRRHQIFASSICSELISLMTRISTLSAPTVFNWNVWQWIFATK